MRRLYTRLTWITSSAEWAETFRATVRKRTTTREKRSSLTAPDSGVGSGCEIPDGTKIGKIRGVTCHRDFTGRGSILFSHPTIYGPRFALLSPARTHFATAVSSLCSLFLSTCGRPRFGLPSPLAYLVKELQASAKSIATKIPLPAAATA